MENLKSGQTGDSLNGNTIPCQSCWRENDGRTIFCRFCNTSLSLTANPDHLQMLSNEGVVYSKAVEAKPKFVILIGVWLMFFPVFVVSAYTLFSLIVGGEGGSIPFLIFWMSILAGGFSFLMVYKVTKNYLNYSDGKKYEDL